MWWTIVYISLFFVEADHSCALILCQLVPPYPLFIAERPQFFYHSLMVRIFFPCEKTAGTLCSVECLDGDCRGLIVCWIGMLVGRLEPCGDADRGDEGGGKHEGGRENG